MGWESSKSFRTKRAFPSFNPSFLLDGLGIACENEAIERAGSFNPSFLLDGLGIKIHNQALEDIEWFQS